MSDFISLNCPSCGQTLPIADSASISDVVSTVYTCGACGVKSALRKDTNKFWLETYAACPMCNLNDRTTKLTALAKAVNRPQIDLRYPVEPRNLDFVPEKFNPKKFLAGHFNSEKFHFVPRAKSQDDLWNEFDSSSRGWMAVGVLLFVVFFIISVYVITDTINLLASLYPTLVILFGIGTIFIPLLLYIVVRTLSNITLVIADKEKEQTLDKQRAKAEQAFRQAETERKKVFDQAELERKKVFEQTEAERKTNFEKTEAERIRVETARWKNAVARWDKSYYCERDDIVFIPGANECESSDKLQQFLYR